MRGRRHEGPGTCPIRRIIPSHFLLVPGIGAQGGSLREVAQYGMNAECGLWLMLPVPSSMPRGMTVSPKSARNEALNLQVDMEELLLEAELL